VRKGTALELTAVAGFVILLGGCSHPPTRFSKVGSNRQQSQQNRAAVNSYGGYSGVIANRGVFMSCMGARGYLLDPNGSLTALPGTEIRMVD
jgi:hypothetical protein